EAACVTVWDGVGFPCGAGSGAGPPAFFGAGSGAGPPANAGAAQVANRVRHTTSTSARRGSISFDLHDPCSSNLASPQGHCAARPSAAMCQTPQVYGLQPQRPTHAAPEPRAPEPNGEEPEVGKTEQHPELQHRPGVLEGPVGKRAHSRLANNGPNGL